MFDRANCFLSACAADAAMEAAKEAVRGFVVGEALSADGDDKPSSYVSLRAKIDQAVPASLTKVEAAIRTALAADAIAIAANNAAFVRNKLRMQVRNGFVCHIAI